MHLRVVHRESCNHELTSYKYLLEWRMPWYQSIFKSFEFDHSRNHFNCIRAMKCIQSFPHGIITKIAGDQIFISRLYSFFLIFTQGSTYKKELNFYLKQDKIQSLAFPSQFLCFDIIALVVNSSNVIDVIDEKRWNVWRLKSRHENSKKQRANTKSLPDVFLFILGADSK